MSLPADLQPLGVPYVIGQAVVQALQAAPDMAGVRVLDNPARATDLAEGARVLFFEDQSDRLRGQPGQQAQRTYAFAMGAIARTTDARQQAHRDYRAAKRAVRACMREITAAGITLEGFGLQEGEVVYRLENIDVGGALVLGSFSVDYRDKGG